MKKNILFIFVFVVFLLTSCGNLNSSIDLQSNSKIEETTEHIHAWQSATCTSPKTCSLCGATEGTPIEHSWKSATCTSPKTCSLCGTTEGTPIEHSWKSATCTQPSTCSVCGKTLGKAKGHSYKEGICTICGDVDQEYLEFQKGAGVLLGLAGMNDALDKQIARIQKAWYFYIYEWNNYIVPYGITAFANYTGLKEELVREAANNYLSSIGLEGDDDISIYATLGTLEGAIYVIQYIYKDLNEKLLDIQTKVRNLLAEMSVKYDSKTKYSLLKEYYAEIQSYLNYCISPSGSYNDLKAKMNSFATNTQRYYSLLSITYSNI